MLGTYENIDCMELMATLKDKEIDLAIVDPPYGIGEDGRKRQSRDFKTDGSRVIKKDPRNGRCAAIRSNTYHIAEWDNEQPPQEYFDELFRVSKRQIICGDNYIQFNQKSSSSGRIFWDKLVAEGCDFSDEEIFWTNLFKGVNRFTFRWGGMLQGKSITEGAINQGNKKLCEQRIHPTQKPVKLYEWLLTNYAKPNDLILDTHCGSASSLIACENLGFKYVASELDTEYYSQSLKRLQDHLAHGKLFQRVGNEVKPEVGLFV